MSDEWSGPAPVAQEYPANEPNGTKRLVDMVVGLKREIRESTSNLLSTAGIFVTKLGMRIASSLTVEGTLNTTGDLISTGSADITGTTHIGGATDIDGTLNVDAATTIGGTLGVTGTTTLGGSTTVNGALGVTGITTLAAATSVTGSLTVIGPMAVTGTLSLPAGIIDNAALASPVFGDAGNATTNGAALTTSFASFAVITFNVPAGYTVAAVNANTAAAIGAGGWPVQIATRIAGADGTALAIYAAGGFGNGASNFSRVFSVTPGGTFTVETRANVTSGTANANLTTAAGVTFYR